MDLKLRRGPATGAAISAASALAIALICISPAAADELTVKNNADVPVKVVVRNGSSEIGRADRIDKKSTGKITLSGGVALARISPSVEATALGVATHCSAGKSGSGYEVRCDAVASAPAAPPSGGSGTAAKLPMRNLEIQNDLKDAVTVLLKHLTSDGKVFTDDHDIKSGASASFTMPVDDMITEFNIMRHLDTQRVNCGGSMRYLIPASQAKMYVTPVDSSTPPPSSVKRADSRPCLLSPTSRTEKADPPAKTSETPPAGGGNASASATTKIIVENDLKDPVQLGTLGGTTEDHVIGPRQSITLDHPVPHPDGKSDTTLEVNISRSVNSRLVNCGVRLHYAIPAVPEMKYYVTRVAGSDWPPKGKPGESDGAGGGGKGGGSLPPPPSCELSRSSKVEK